MGTYAREAADALHASTKHGTPPLEPDRLVSYQRLDPTNAPDPFKHYRDIRLIRLPREVVPSQLPAERVLSGLSERDAQKAIDARLVATLLFLTGGVTRTAGGPGGRQIFFRAAQSAGNLQPVELYVVAGPDLDGITPGVHHFAPLEFGLGQLRTGDYRALLDVTERLVIVLTGLVWRTAWKYGERGWRHLYWDAGSMIANLLAAADAHGLSPQVITAFDDELVARLVGIDGVDETPLAIVTLGPPSDRPEAAELEVPTLKQEVAPVARDPIRLPLLVEAQGGSGLNAEQVNDWRNQAGAVAKAASSGVDPPRGDGHLIEDVILQRGSTRVMRPEQVPSDALTWPMEAATRAVPWDVGDEGTLLSHYVSIHGVQGVEPGAYRWTPLGPELIAQSSQARQIGAALCLNQPLGGDSAFTTFHHADLEAISDALGSRGHRAAQLEAGIVSGRLGLCAFALGLGATGLTFFDDPVSEYFSTASSPMLVTAVGVPTAPPAPFGTPGSPAQLRQSRVSVNLNRARRS